MSANEKQGAGEKLLFIVEDALRIEGKNVILTPRFLPELIQIQPFSELCVRLQRPDGSSLCIPDAKVAVALNLKNPRRPILIRTVTKDDVPRGTEVWYVPEAREPDGEIRCSDCPS